MLARTGTSLPFVGWFTKNKVGATGLTVTVDVYRDGTQIVTGGSAAAIGGGLYQYDLASGSNGTAGNYYAIFKTADTTVDAQQVPSYWSSGRTWVQNLDGTISGIPASVWNYLASAATTVGSLGKRIADFVDASIASRSTFAGGAVASVTGAVGSVTGNVGGSVASVASNVNTNANSVETGIATAVAALPTAAQNASATRTNLTPELNRIDQPISSRLATTDYAAPPSIAGLATQSTVDAIKERTDNLPDAPALESTSQEILAAQGDGGFTSDDRALLVSAEDNSGMAVTKLNSLTSGGKEVFSQDNGPATPDGGELYLIPGNDYLEQWSQHASWRFTTGLALDIADSAFEVWLCIANNMVELECAKNYDTDGALLVRCDIPGTETVKLRDLTKNIDYWLQVVMEDSELSYDPEMQLVKGSVIKGTYARVNTLPA